MVSVLTVFALLLVGCRVSEAYITCHECLTISSNAQESANCNDPFNENGLRTCVGLTCTKSSYDCSAFPEFCQASQVSAVFRGCSNSSIQYDNCGTTSYSNGKVFSCVCNSDRCNDAQVMRSINKMAAATIAVILSAVFI